MKNIPRGGSTLTRKILRKESGFGCAICGEPYLTYHHFDPPWSEKNHDNPLGMIALCAKHADQADGGAYTKDQLRKYKSNSSIYNSKLLSKFEWFRNDFLFLLGSLVVFKCDVLLQVRYGKVIWLEKDSDTNLKSLCLDIRNEKGETILKMYRNQWESDISKISDIESSKQGKHLKIISKIDRTNFDIKFQNYSQDKLKIKLLSMGFSEDMSANITQEAKTILGVNIPVCILTGDFFLPAPVKLTKNKSIISTITIRTSYIGHSPVGLNGM